MTVIGSKKYAQSDGQAFEINLHEPGTFPHEPVRLALSDGRVGVPFLTSPASEADTPFRVAASDGTVYGIRKRGGIIEDWERGDFGPWESFNHRSLTEMDINATAARSGSFGLDSQGQYQGHFGSYPGDGLTHYPERGDTFECWIQADTITDSTPIARYQWELDPNWSDHETENVYRLHYVDDSLQFQKRVNGSTTGLLSFPEASVTSSDGWVGTRVVYGDPTIEITLLDSAGADVVTRSVNDTTHDLGGAGGVAMYVNDHWRCFFDDWTVTFD